MLMVCMSSVELAVGITDDYGVNIDSFESLDCELGLTCAILHSPDTSPVQSSYKQSILLPLFLFAALPSPLKAGPNHRNGLSKPFEVTFTHFALPSLSPMLHPHLFAYCCR